MGESQENNITKRNGFLGTVCKIAIPVTLQCMLQSSFSMVDQIMIGQLGSVSIAAVGLAGKFSSIFSVVLSAVAAVAGIMIAQYMGAKQEREVDKSFSINLVVAIVVALLFLILCVGIPERIMSAYTKEAEIQKVAADYLRIVAFTFIPMAGASLLSTMLRCMEKAALPLYASVLAAVLNTGLNYILIFGKLGFTPLGVKGAATATLVSQIANFLFMFVVFMLLYQKQKKKIYFSLGLGRKGYTQYFHMLWPLLLTEFLWSLGENVYASIYGHLGTDACAAMTLTNPIQGILIGALSGMSQAAAILIGKRLGNKEYDKAYVESKKITLYSLTGAVALSVVLLGFKTLYVDIYQVENSVKIVAGQILIVYAFIAPVKVLNMVLGGGILRSGGKTKILMFIDLTGTWIFGVPLGLLSAFVFKLSIPYVYLILSMEECVRLGISIIMFRKKTWMNSLEVEEGKNSNE